MSDLARFVGEEEAYARHLGTEIHTLEVDRVVLRMPYREAFGDNRVHGGAIAGLVDIAATAAFWSLPDLSEAARGATVGFDIHFLRASGAQDLTAEARVRRRGGSLSTGEVTVRGEDGSEVACATVTYKLTDRGG